MSEPDPFKMSPAELQAYLDKDRAAPVGRQVSDSEAMEMRRAVVGVPSAEIQRAMAEGDMQIISLFLRRGAGDMEVVSELAEWFDPNGNSDFKITLQRRVGRPGGGLEQQWADEPIHNAVVSELNGGISTKQALENVASNLGKSFEAVRLAYYRHRNRLK